MARKYQKFRDSLNEDLKDKKYAETFLKVSLEDYRNDGDIASFISAVRVVAEAQGGLGQLAKKTKSKRQTIYNALSKVGNPTLSTLDEILRNIGFCLSIERLPKAVG